MAPELGNRLGLTASRARMVLAGRDDDPTPPLRQELAPDEELRGHLSALPDGGDTGSLLARLVEAGSDELKALLGRQKITPALLEHVGNTIRD